MFHHFGIAQLIMQNEVKDARHSLYVLPQPGVAFIYHPVRPLECLSILTCAKVNVFNTVLNYDAELRLDLSFHFTECSFSAGYRINCFGKMTATNGRVHFED